MGLFSGKKVSVSFEEAPPNHGIVFQRNDLLEKPRIPALIDSVYETLRCTILGNKEVKISTVEHLLSALYAHGINNLLIKVDGPELPIGDGSSLPFVELIKEAKSIPQSTPQTIYSLRNPVYWSQGHTHLMALPADEYRISYTLHYPHSAFIGSQYYSFAVSQDSYNIEIASSRTFSLYEEVVPMLEKGFLTEAGLNNGVVVKDDQVLNSEGLRFSDEMVRHKILDLMGDLSLMGLRFNAHIIAVRSGHYSNVEFAKVLKEKLIAETYS